MPPEPMPLRTGTIMDKLLFCCSCVHTDTNLPAMHWADPQLETGISSGWPRRSLLQHHPELCLCCGGAPARQQGLDLSGCTRWPCLLHCLPQWAPGSSHSQFDYC